MLAKASKGLFSDSDWDGAPKEIIWSGMRRRVGVSETRHVQGLHLQRFDTHSNTVVRNPQNHHNSVSKEILGRGKKVKKGGEISLPEFCATC